jgi:hypothetical protein
MVFSTKLVWLAWWQVLLATDINSPRPYRAILCVGQQACITVLWSVNLETYTVPGAYQSHLITDNSLSISVRLYSACPDFKFNDKLHCSSIIQGAYAAFASSRRRRACLASNSGSMDMGTDRPFCAL